MLPERTHLELTRKEGEMEEMLVFEVLARKARETSLVLGGSLHFHKMRFLIV